MFNKVVVSDTNIWIDLYRSGLLEVVFQLKHHFVTTEFVIHELKSPRGEHLVSLGLGVEVLASTEMLTLFDLRHTLGNSSLADVSCYFLAKERGWTLLTGDGALRRSGHRSQLEVRGVLWLLDQFHEAALVSPDVLVKALNAMLANGARLPKEECLQRLQAWSALSP
ncbi:MULTISPECIES: hypothetical protein [Vreelandella]|uniref:hypothetical protein n=1 Tax=Vreelandella TaxID=3137766 RepID=UPI00300E3CDD|tara:strand:- start:20545 stop:21045 length:501 start_codon:yes stop_codon:yes gene_type:complete